MNNPDASWGVSEFGDEIFLKGVTPNVFIGGPPTGPLDSGLKHAGMTDTGKRLEKELCATRIVMPVKTGIQVLLCDHLILALKAHQFAHPVSDTSTRLPSGSLI